jgi:hypothetical protein
LSTVTTCCCCPLAAACFFAASIALSCCDAQPAIIATPSTSATPVRFQLASVIRFAFIVSPSVPSAQLVDPTHSAASREDSIKPESAARQSSKMHIPRIGTP